MCPGSLREPSGRPPCAGKGQFCYTSQVNLATLALGSLRGPSKSSAGASGGLPRASGKLPGPPAPLLELGGRLREASAKPSATHREASGASSLSLDASGSSPGASVPFPGTSGSSRASVSSRRASVWMLERSSLRSPRSRTLRPRGWPKNQKPKCGGFLVFSPLYLPLAAIQRTPNLLQSLDPCLGSCIIVI